MSKEEELSLIALEKRVLALEAVPQNSDLLDFQKFMLTRLETIRLAMTSTETSNHASAAFSEGTSSEHVQSLEKENEKLKKELARANYRIQILLKSLNEEEAKNIVVSNK